MIKLVRQDYQKNKCLFNKIKSILLVSLGNDAKIEHVGSTAIPNMSGKNIIDILVGASNIELLELFAEKIGKECYYPSNKNNTQSGYLFFASSQSETKSGDIHIHLVLEHSQRYKDFLYLRDYLLIHPDEAKKYSDNKYMIAREIKNEREGYKKLKSEYVNKLIILSREELDGKVSE